MKRMAMVRRLWKPLFPAILFLWPVVSWGADVTLIPSLKARGEYDDNVLFSRTVEVDDYLAILSPGLEFDYATAALSLRSTLNVDILRYLDETNLNTENQRYAIDGTLRPVERLMMSAGFRYVDDTTLDSELQETGLVGIRSDRKRFEGNGGLGFEFTELSEVRVDYSYTSTDYDFRGYEDYVSHAVALAFNRRLGTEKDTLTAQPFFTLYDSEVSRVEVLGFSLGWSHAFHEKMNLSASLGVRYSDIEYRIFGRVETESEWGGVGDIALRYAGELAVWTLGYTADLRYSAYGEPINVHQGYGSVNWRVTERFTMNLAASYYDTKSEGDLSIQYENSRYLEVRPTASYRITEHHAVDLGYTYATERDESIPVGDKTSDRNKVWISFNFRYPTKW